MLEKKKPSILPMSMPLYISSLEFFCFRSLRLAKILLNQTLLLDQIVENFVVGRPLLVKTAQHRFKLVLNRSLAASTIDRW